jgi:putative peptidoglycan lipid II flippase
MTSRILGVVREQVLAAYFGAGNAMDAYNVAYRIPNLVRDLFAEGAMSSAFVPTFTRHLTTEGKASAWRLGNLVLNALIVITGVLVIAGIVFAEPLVSLFASAFREVPGKLELTVFLTRLMLPFLTFVALAAAFMGMLNSLHRFFIPALSPAMYNVATISCAFLLIPVMSAMGLPCPPSPQSRSGHFSAASRSWQFSGRRSGGKDSATGRCSIGATRRSGGCSC